MGGAGERAAIMPPKEGVMKYVIWNKQILNNALSEIMQIEFDERGEAIKPIKQIEIRDYKKPRTLDQNRYYWGVVLKTIADDVGEDVESLHEYFAEKYLLQEVREIFGNDVKIRKSTTKLSTKEFNEYIEKIRAEMAQFGFIIPDPDGEQ